MDHKYPPVAVNIDRLSSMANVASEDRRITRTPSPSPSEIRAMQPRIVNWKASLKNWKSWFRKDWIGYYIAASIILTVLILIVVYQDEIVTGLAPVGRWLKDRSWGWIIPVLLMIVLSFPPLFGAELVHLLCGLVWGPGVGFGIVALGTFLGELCNFYAFRLLCMTRAEKLEKTNISYACLAEVVREGGFWIALIVRLSAIPPHFATAVFSACKMKILTFCLAAILSLPRQFAGVYLGSTFEENSNGKKNKKDQVVSALVAVVTIIITVIAMKYVSRKMRNVLPEIIYRRRKERQIKLDEEQLEAAISTNNTNFSSSSNTVIAYPTPRYPSHDKDTQTRSTPSMYLDRPVAERSSNSQTSPYPQYQ